MPCLVIRVSDETSRLNISIHKEEKNINTLITKIGDPFIVDFIYNNLEISPRIHKIGESLNITTEKKNSTLNIGCSILCSVTAVKEYYLNVTEGVIWLNESNGYSQDVEVVSNVQWTVTSDIAVDDVITTYLHNADDISNATMVSNIAISEYTHISNQLDISNEVLIRNG